MADRNPPTPDSPTPPDPAPHSPTGVWAIRTLAEASLLLHPLRLRILELLREPDSATGLARRLDLPRQKVNYHLRELEKAGLLVLVEAKSRGSCQERVVRAVAGGYVLSPEILGNLAADPETVGGRSSPAHLLASASESVLAVARASADPESPPATLTLRADVFFRTPEERHEFTQALAEEFARLVDSYRAEGAAPSAGPDTSRLLVLLHPSPAS